MYKCLKIEGFWKLKKSYSLYQKLNKFKKSMGTHEYPWIPQYPRVPA